MTVVHVRCVWVVVDESHMPVRVHVGLSRRVPLFMLMLMMLVMDMSVLVLEIVVGVKMRVPLAKE